MKNGKIILGVTAFAILATALAVMLSASAYDHDQTYNANSIYFVPEIARVQEGHCHTTTVDVWTNTSVAIASGYVVFDYTQCCADVTNIQIDTVNWQDPGCAVFDDPGQVRIKFLNATANGPGPVHLATLTIHCCNASSCCLTNMTWNVTYPSYLEDDMSAEILGVNWADGVFACGDPINVTKTVKDPATGVWVPSYSFPMGDEEPGVNVTFNITVHAKCCDLTNIAVTDILADKLSYANSATVNGVPCEPQVNGQTLTWSYNAGACQNNFTDLDICNKIYIEFNATVTEYGEHKNSANATGWCNKFALPVQVSNTSEAWVNLPSPARIEVIKTVWDPAKQKWVKAITPELDYVDIGNPASEAGHDVYNNSASNWSYIGSQSCTSWPSPGCLRLGGYGGYDGGNADFRGLMGPPTGCGAGSEYATFTMNAGSVNATQLVLRHLDGAQDDSFDVFIVEGGQDILIGQYAFSGNTNEYWTTTTFNFAPRSGEIKFKLNATDSVTTWCTQGWGQVMINWAKLVGDRAKICETYRFNCTIHNDGSEGLDLMNIEVWDIMTDSLEYAGNASMVTPDGITRDINPPTDLSGDKTRFNWTIDDYMQTPLTLHPCQSIIMEFDAHIVNYCNNSNTQYARGQTSEGIWVYDNDTAWIKIPHPDLNVTKITVNPKLSRLCDMAFGPTNHTGARTQCNNISADIVEGKGIDVVFPFNVTFEVTNTTTGDSVLREPCIVRIPGTVANPSLEGGDTKTVYCNCSWYPFAHENYTISVTVDSNKTVDSIRGEIRESDENNNTMVRNIAAHVHGYKGNSHQDGRNITALQCHEQGTINLTYSIGDSSKKGTTDLYNAGGIYLANWTASDFNIPPAESCIKKARLYVYYNWDKSPDWNVTDYFTLKFNEHTISPDAIYNDVKHPDRTPVICAGCPGSYTMCKYNQPYGMVAYDVMQEFVAGDNTANLALDPYVWQNNYTAMTGMLLVVVYNNSAEPERIIWINEGFDILLAREAYGTNSEEATTYAPFTPFAGDGCDAIPLNKIGKATLITITNHAANTPAQDRNRLYFNGDLLGSGVWYPYIGATEIGDAVTDVPLNLLNATNNTAAFQSHITPTTYGDTFEATNAFFVLEKGKATIEVVDPPECVGVGEQFDVPINVTPDNAAVYGVEYVIEFNASVIHAEWQNEGDFLKHGGASTNVYRNVIDNVNGKLEFAVTRVAPATGATVPGTLATIHFTAIEPSATTTVNLIHVKATDSEADLIYVVTVNSTVEVCDNTPPIADGKSRFTHNNVGAKYLSRAYFDGSASSDPDGYITYYRWWFGDGNDGVGETAEHVYGSFKWNVNSYDPFNVSLTVQDDGTPILDDTDYLDVNVYMAGDTNGDGEVDIVDGSIVGLEFWAECLVGDNNWGSADRRDMADLNNDCEVDIIDASIVGVTFWDTAW